MITAPAILGASPSDSRKSDWFGGNMPAARLGLILNLLIPLTFLAWDAKHGKLGADPTNLALHTTGLTAVVFLLASLAVTPVRMVSSATWLIQFRRSLGVYAFYYACAHLAIYFWWDRGHNLHSTVYEITHRYYLMIGFISLVLMAPLWATSFNAAIRAMGGVWWKRLHRLTYIAAGLGCWHFYLQSKADKHKPEIYIAVLTGLLLWRVGAWVIGYWRAPVKSSTAAVAGVMSIPARFWRGELKVIGMFKETEAVRTFRFSLANGAPIPFAFRPGQFLNLSLEIDGRRAIRSYTIASPPTRTGYVELTVKREENGHVSRFLHDMLMTGQGVAISAPTGKFVFDSEAHEAVLFLAGGVGITPVMSILRDLTDRCWHGKIDLFFSVRNVADIIFREELHYLASRHPNLHVHVTITRDAPVEWSGLRGRITSDLVRQQVPDAANRIAFICGPTEMAVAARAELLALGSPSDRINVESFTPAAAIATEHDTTLAAPNGVTATVTFSKLGRSAVITPNQTVLEAAESAGVSIDYQCRSGICGTCRCKLLSGHVTMSARDALSDSDEAEGYILACQACTTGDITVQTL